MCLMAYISSSRPLSQFIEKDRRDGIFLAKGVRRHVPVELSEMPHCYYIGDSACSCILMSDGEDGQVARKRALEIAEAAVRGEVEPVVFLEWIGETERAPVAEVRAHVSREPAGFGA